MPTASATINDSIPTAPAGNVMSRSRKRSSPSFRSSGSLVRLVRVTGGVVVHGAVTKARTLGSKSLCPSPPR